MNLTCPSAKTALPRDVFLGAVREAPQQPMLATTRLEAMLQDWRGNRAEAWLTHRVGLLPHLPEISHFPADDPEKFKESIGQSIGTLVHRLFEMKAVLKQSTATRRDLLEVMAANLLADSPGSYGPSDDDTPTLSQATVQRVVEGVEAVLKKVQASGPGAEAVRRLLEADGDAEVDFALQLGRWHISGRFDKLIRHGDGFEIVDWKTDAGSSPAAIADRHRPQMQLYALALYRAGKHVLVQGSIRVHLAMLHFPRVETLSFTMEQLEKHARELAGDLSNFDAYEPARTAAW